MISNLRDTWFLLEFFGNQFAQLFYWNRRNKVKFSPLVFTLKKKLNFRILNCLIFCEFDFSLHGEKQTGSETAESWNPDFFVFILTFGIICDPIEICPLFSMSASRNSLFPSGNLTDLPDELLLLIFSYLSRNSVLAVRSVCKSLHSIATHNSLWRTFLLDSFCFLTQPRPGLFFSFTPLTVFTQIFIWFSFAWLDSGQSYFEKFIERSREKQNWMKPNFKPLITTKFVNYQHKRLNVKTLKTHIRRTILVLAEKGRTVLWDLEKKEAFGTFETDEKPICHILCENSDWVLISTTQSSHKLRIYLYNVKTKERYSLDSYHPCGLMIRGNFMLQGCNFPTQLNLYKLSVGHEPTIIYSNNKTCQGCITERYLLVPTPTDGNSSLTTLQLYEFDLSASSPKFLASVQIETQREVDYLLLSENMKYFSIKTKGNRMYVYQTGYNHITNTFTPSCKFHVDYDDIPQMNFCGDLFFYSVKTLTATTLFCNDLSKTTTEPNYSLSFPHNRIFSMFVIDSEKIIFFGSDEQQKSHTFIYSAPDGKFIQKFPFVMESGTYNQTVSEVTKLVSMSIWTSMWEERLYIVYCVLCIVCVSQFNMMISCITLRFTFFGRCTF